MSFEFEAPVYLWGLLLTAVLYWGYRYSLSGFSRKQRRWSLVVRTLILILLVFALAGLDWLKPTHEQKFVVLQDVSRSVETNKTPAHQAWKKIIASLPADTVLMNFGTDTETDIAAGIEKARAAVPAGFVPHIILVSDGNDTTGYSVPTHSLAVVSAVPLPSSAEPEIQVAELTVVQEQPLKQGQPFDLTATVQSNNETESALILYRSGFKVDEKKRPLKTGETIFTFHQTATENRETEYTVELKVEGGDVNVKDTIAENNRLTTIVIAEGKPKILLLDTEPAQLRDFVSAMKEQDIAIDVRGTFRSAALSDYDAIILSNIPATALSQMQMQQLRDYVQTGGGLMMFGSADSFGLGGYYKTPIEEVLPVRCDLEKDKEKPAIALCLVIDRSGSMGGQKMELAKDAAKAAVELLTPKDYAAVIAFDNESHIVAPATSAAQPALLISAISTIEPAGGTNIYPALTDALEQLRRTTAKLKHVILLTDGQSAPGDFEGVVRQMSSERITVSTVGIGEADNDLLKQLADIGKGRHYACDDPKNVPQIFAKETVTASKNAIREEPFVPLPVSPTSVLDGIDMDNAPPLLGYVAAQAKPAAKFVLGAGYAAEQNAPDPLLIWHRYGLGMSAAFTSDVKPRWAAEWLTWQDFGKFWSQVLRSIMRPNTGDGIFTVRLENVRTDRLRLMIDAVDKNGQFINNAAGNAQAGGTRISLLQTAPGRYEAVVPFSGKSAHINLSLTQDGKPLLNTTRAVAENYPAELRMKPANETLLKELAEQAGGLYNPAAEQLRHFKTDKTAYQAKPLRNWLIVLAALLFILDVFLRRVEVM